MDKKIREAQKDFLRAFSKNPGSFALAGGTALELYYLHHRFSADLDFFSPRYNLREVKDIVLGVEKHLKKRIKLESEFIMENRAKVCFYSTPIRGSNRPLKIDFVEDVLFKTPGLRKFDGIPVYSAENIYFQKIIALTGTRFEESDTGQQETQGRKEARDVFDVYMLSKKIKPLYLFLKGTSRPIQRSMVRWYQTFSRQDLKLGVLDLDIYDKNFDAREMIIYLENQIKRFVKEVMTE